MALSLNSTERKEDEEEEEEEEEEDLLVGCLALGLRLLSVNRHEHPLKQIESFVLSCTFKVQHRLRSKCGRHEK